MAEKEENTKVGGAWWKPAMIFYAKTTCWIVIPVVLGLVLGTKLRDSTGSQIWFFILIILSFAVTCFGIYREIKNYQKNLEEKNDK